DLGDHGSYWLSPTPDTPWTAGFAPRGQLPRLVVWARLLERTSGRELFFGTTHFDNNSPSQEKSAPIVLERTEPWAARMPVILTADFNSQPEDLAYVLLRQGDPGSRFHFLDAYDLTGGPTIDSNLVPPPAYDASRRIDHIFVAGGDKPWRCAEWVL